MKFNHKHKRLNINYKSEHRTLTITSHTEPQETYILDETDVRRFAEELKTELHRWSFWNSDNGGKQINYDWIIDSVLDCYLNDTDNSLEKL